MSDDAHKQELRERIAEVVGGREGLDEGGTYIAGSLWWAGRRAARGRRGSARCACCALRRGAVIATAGSCRAPIAHPGRNRQISNPLLPQENFHARYEDLDSHEKR
jgi:hypothetical protein